MFKSLISADEFGHGPCVGRLRSTARYLRRFQARTSPQTDIAPYSFDTDFLAPAWPRRSPGSSDGRAGHRRARTGRRYGHGRQPGSDWRHGRWAAICGLTSPRSPTWGLILLPQSAVHVDEAPGRSFSRTEASGTRVAELGRRIAGDAGVTATESTMAIWMPPHRLWRRTATGTAVDLRWSVRAADGDLG
jgi:hypothetical protein